MPYKRSTRFGKIDKKKMMIIIGVAVLVLILLGGGYMFYSKKSKFGYGNIKTYDSTREASRVCGNGNFDTVYTCKRDTSFDQQNTSFDQQNTLVEPINLITNDYLDFDDTTFKKLNPSNGGSYVIQASGRMSSPASSNTQLITNDRIDTFDLGNSDLGNMVVPIINPSNYGSYDMGEPRGFLSPEQTSSPASSNKLMTNDLINTTFGQAVPENSFNNSFGKVMSSNIGLGMAPYLFSAIA